MKPSPFKLPRRVVDLLRPDVRAELQRAVKMLEGLQRLQLVIRSAGKSVAGSIQITGRTALLTGIASLGSPKVRLECTSESGSATLCGFSEFSSPSTPPKKYRKRTASGTASASYSRGVADCSLASCAWVDGFSGSKIYDPLTCLVSGSNIATRVGTCGNDGVSTTDTLCDNYGALVAMTCTTSPTNITMSNAGGCHITAGDSLKYTAVTAVMNLTDEDTENDAIARATGTTPGASCTAAHQPRGAGVFTFNFVAVAYDFACTGLITGKTYRLTYTLLTETYGGGGGVTTTHTLDFTASGASEAISDSLDCASGKQVTISGASIAAL